jgi:tetratricopeptide (TPR) repeat protein
VWTVTEEDKHLGSFAQGVWKIDSVTENIQLYRYTSGGVFNKHRDGPTFHSVNKRSFFTVLVYLNEGYTEGDTVVFTDDLVHSYKVPHSLGGCFVMLQRILHEGSRVAQGIKYALRCDIMYSRSSGSAEESIRHLDTQQQAQKWFDFASSMELSGRIDESIAYYKKAYKLDPNVT